MTSCGGTSRTTVRSEMRTMRSKGQKMNVSPGPLGAGESRPSQNVTALSYSLRMFTHRETKTSATTTAARRKGPGSMFIGVSLGRFLGTDEDEEALHADDLQ